MIFERLLPWFIYVHLLRHRFPGSQPRRSPARQAVRESHSERRLSLTHGFPFLEGGPFGAQERYKLVEPSGYVPSGTC